MVIAHPLESLSAPQLRELAASLIAEVGARDKVLVRKDQEILYRQTKINQLTHEIAVLKRWKFGRSREQLDSTQGTLLEEAAEADLAAIERELEQLTETASSGDDTKESKQQPKRAALPPQLPRTDHHHEPEHTTCDCGCQLKRIGEDVSEKLDYTPGVFTVERHIRGKWACARCQTLTQAPVPAQVIDKGMATAGLLAQVLVAKYADHLPLYRQESIFGRAGLTLSRSTLAQWVGVCGVQLQPLVDALKSEILKHRVLHADETPVAMLSPGKKKTHRAYLWAYAPGVFEHLKAVVYDFAETRAGEHARTFLADWRGSLVCDDFSGYKASFAQGVIEVGCAAHARRKFFDLYASNKSPVAEQALKLFAELYKVEVEVKNLDGDERRRIRLEKAGPISKTMHDWMQLQRARVTDGTAIAKALDYSLKRWPALVRYVEDGQLPIDNNWIENQIRPIAIGRSNWLFAGSLRAGQRAAAVMSLIQSAKLNGLDPHAYLKDVLSRLPSQKASQIGDLLPHRWQPEGA